MNDKTKFANKLPVRALFTVLRSTAVVNFSIRKWMHPLVILMWCNFHLNRCDRLFNGFWCNSTSFFFSLSCGRFVLFACDIFIEWINKSIAVHVQCLNARPLNEYGVCNTSCVVLMPRTNPALWRTLNWLSINNVCKQKELVKNQIQLNQCCSQNNLCVCGVFPTFLHRRVQNGTITRRNKTKVWMNIEIFFRTFLFHF